MTDRLMNQLEFINIHFSYGPCEVINGIDLSIRSGEVVGLIGPNGAGKTTLIKLMSGVLAPAEGTILLDEKPLGTIPSKERAKQIALMPQESHIPFPFKSLEVVLMGRAPYMPRFGFESRRDIDIALDAMRKTDCIKFAGRDINALSGGERHRVIMARALAQRPKLLLLDEPATFLDIGHTAELARLLKQLNRDEELTIVCAMHDLNVAAALCHRLVFIKDGRIAASGPPCETISPSIIRDVFGVDAHVTRDDRTGMPYCLPL